MLQTKLKNEHGMTLVELLAALALFSIVIVLGGTLISSINSSENYVSSDISLQQNTNILISEMRQAYYSGAGDEKLYFKFDSEELSIQTLNVNNGEVFNEGTPNPYIKNIDYSTPLKIKLTTASSNGQTVSLDTTWYATEKKEIILGKKESEKENGKGDYEWGKEVEYLPCYSEGNVKWKGKHYEKNCGQYNNDEDPYIVNGALWINDQMGHSKQAQGGRIVVKKDFFAEDQITLKNSFSIMIDGNADFEGQVDFKNGASIEVGGSSVFDNQVNMKNNARLVIGGSGLFKDQIDMKNGSSIIIGGNGTFEDQVDKKNNIIVGGNSSFEE